MSRKLTVLIVAIVMAAVTLLSPLCFTFGNFGGGSFGRISAILWVCDLYSTGARFITNSGEVLLFMVLIGGVPNFVFAVLIVSFVAGRATTRGAVLSGVLGAIWPDILVFVSCLPYTLLGQYEYLADLPVPIPAQMAIGLTLAWLLRLNPDNSIWSDEVGENITGADEAGLPSL